MLRKRRSSVKVRAHVLGNQRPVGPHGIHPLGTAASGPPPALPSAALPSAALPAATLPATTQPTTAHMILPFPDLRARAQAHTGRGTESTLRGQQRQQISFELTEACHVAHSKRIEQKRPHAIRR